MTLNNISTVTADRTDIIYLPVSRFC